MAKKTTKKKAKGKGKGAAAAGKDLVIREISGIALFVVSVLAAFALSGSYSQAVSLNAFRAGMLKVFGMTSVFIPIMTAMTGGYFIWQKKELLKIMGHMTLSMIMLGMFLNLTVGDPGRAILLSREVIASSGGALTGWLATWMASMISVPGAIVFLIATGLIYSKFALGVSYEELGKKAAPYIMIVVEALKKVLGSGVESVQSRLKEMADNRQKRLQAEKEQREREEQKKIQAMQEEEARAMATGQGFMDPLEEEPVKKEKAPKKKANLTLVEMPQVDAHEDDVEEVVPFSKAESGIQNVIVDEYEEIDEEPRIEVKAAEGEGEEEIMWKLPRPEDWLDENLHATQAVVDNTMREKLERTLQSFQVPARISNVVQGPSFTRFEIELEPGTKVSRIVSLEQDIALALATDSKTIRIEAPIPGKSAIGIEIPNKERAMVPIRNIFMSPSFRATKVPLSFVLGEDIDGHPIFSSITKMPHLLVAGSTGSGKSVCLNAIITNIIAREFPSESRFIMVDMKRVELTPYDGIPHLMSPVIQEAQQAANALKWVCNEMDKRYQLYHRVGVRNIEGYNNYVENPAEKMHRIVFIIDELADLMMVSSSNMNIENYICRIAQLARATGIHLILATQRPDTKVITGTIKNNIPSRIAFAVASQVDSRTIIDHKGAETLLGRGDLLFQSFGANRLKRLQGAFVSDEEVNRLVNFWKAQGTTEYPLRFEDAPGVIGANGSDEFVSEDEKLYFQAVEIVIQSQQASISMIQRRLRIGYNRAARLVELMEERGIVGPHDGSRPREVLTNSLDGASNF